MLAEMQDIRNIKENKELASGVNIFSGNITCEAVAKAFDYEYIELERMI